MNFKKLFIFLLIIFFLALLSVYYQSLKTNFKNLVENKKINYEFEKAFVIRVIDGDTIEVKNDNGKYEVRLLGINTPEKGNPYYQDAKEFLKEIENKSIELARDKEDTDKYKRKLRYVFYNGRFINIEILEKGLATTFMIENLVYEKKFRYAENFSMKNEIGLWEKSKEKCSECIKLKEINPKEEFFVLENICSFECSLDGWIVKDNANHFFKLDKMNSYETKRYDSKNNVWNDDHDRFFLRDKNGKLVIFKEY